MRRILAAAGVFVLMGSVCYGQEQEVTPTLTSGTGALLFTFDGLSLIRANNFDGGVGFKVFLSEMTAVRGALQLSKGSGTIAANPVAPDTGVDGSTDGTTIGFSVALERHLSTARVSPYIGAGGGFSTTRTEATNVVVGNPPGPQTTTTNANFGHVISGTLFQGGSTVQGFGLVGFEFFMTKGLSFSAEYRVGIAKTSRKDQEVTTGATTTTTKIGSSTLVNIASSGLFTMAVYF